MIKAMEIQLPDFLPSRYKNWLELYLDVYRTMHESGCPINDETKVKLFEMGDHEEQKDLTSQYGEHIVAFYQEFPLILIKARALDFILPNLPTKDEMYSIYLGYMSAKHCTTTVEKNAKIIEGILNICKPVY